MRAVVIVLDGVGCGAMPDAAAYGDEGANSLANTARALGGLALPNLARLGLGNIIEIEGVPPTPDSEALHGRMAERSAGKDTTAGHWELAGLPVLRPFPVYPGGFPQEVIARFEEAIGRSVLGNRPASGTAIVAELGEEHLRTGRPIVYTSADSVFQVAAHEEIVPVETLYDWCGAARELLQGEHGVCRVIARPFVGAPGGFQRTPRRRDFSLEPFGPTVLDAVRAAGMDVLGVGKIDDIFANRGVTECVHTSSNADGMERVLDYLARPFEGLLFANLVETDSLWGHRNDPLGYARALGEFDAWLPRLREAGRDDLLIVTADHGVDPTTEATDHSREYVPVLCVHPDGRSGALGTRATFADAAATVAHWLGVEFETEATPFFRGR